MKQNDVALWEKHFESCKRNGMVYDQVETFCKMKYIPHNKQQQFHAAARAADSEGSAKYILFGGAKAGGKTTAAFCQLIEDCQRFPGLKCLFIRRVQKSAHESFLDLVAHTTKYIPHSIKNNQLIFPNGSFILYGGCRSSAELLNYQGLEYDAFGIEELTQFEYEPFKILEGSLRTGRTDGWRPRMYLTTNPGEIGHDWVKKMFVDPYRNNTQTDTIFIPALGIDNPHINKEYHDYLDSLTGNQRLMWRDGIWDLHAGRAFPTFGEGNTINDYVPQDGDILYRGVDYGITDPYCCLWIAYQPTFGRVIVYREDYGSGYPAGAQADRIMSMTSSGERIAITYSDPAMFGKTSTADTITSVASIYQDRGLILTRGDNDHVNGKRKVDNLLAIKPDGKPGLLVTQNCTNFIRQMINLITDEKRPDDIRAGQEEHAYDAFRYSISSVRDVIIRDRQAQRMKRQEVSPLLMYFPN
jgi:phage terminase large subunit